MFSGAYVQSYISPICRCTRRDKGFWIEQLHGTGFLISSRGFFLTACHVLDAAFADAKENGGEVGIFPTQDIEGQPRSLNVLFQDYEPAPKPFDVAIFHAPSYSAKTLLRLQKRDVDIWQDVAATGYPGSITHKTPEMYQLQQRAHKGYVQRCIPAGRLQPGNNPDSFELSFPITKGLSGSPLFIHQHEYEIVIGICVGSHASSVVQYESLTLEEEDKRTYEKIARVEEFGIAHDLRPLLDWKPLCLSGISLGEV